jgi:hypothetical protein
VPGAEPADEGAEQRHNPSLNVDAIPPRLKRP